MNRKKAVVTGASSGIGRATALRLAADGFDVIVLARREAELKKLLSDLTPGEHDLLVADYSQGETESLLRELIISKWGGSECAGYIHWYTCYRRGKIFQPGPGHDCTVPY